MQFIDPLIAETVFLTEAILRILLMSNQLYFEWQGKQQKINRVLQLVRLITQDQYVLLLIQYQVMLKENMLRNLPSTKPIKSPSPDSKRKNIITPTKSPQKDIAIKIAHSNLQELFHHRKYSSNNKNHNQDQINNLNNLIALHYTSLISQAKSTGNLNTNQSDTNNIGSNQFNNASSRVQQQGMPSPQAFNISFSHQGEMNRINLSPYQAAQANIIDSSIYKTPKYFIPQSHIMQSQSNQKSNQYRGYTGKSGSKRNDISSSLKQHDQKNRRILNLNNLKGPIQQGASSYRYFQQTIRQKDQVISELRNILTMISESESKQSSGKIDLSERKQQQQLKKQMLKQIHVLTIQNQKLLGIIDRISNRQNDPNKSLFNRGGSTSKQEKQQQLEQLKKQILQLQQSIISNRMSHQKQIDSLLKSHKSLANHCNDIQKNFKIVQQQNKRLLKLLQQKDSSQRQLFQQKRASQFSVKSDNLSDKDKEKGDKLTISKIKEQYNENMKLFKQSVYDQVDQMYNTIQQTIQQTNDRLIISQNRVKQLQQRLESFEKNVVTVIAQKQIKKKNPQIYIEEAPSSSSDREGQEHDKSLRSDYEQEQQQQSQSTKQQYFGHDELGAKLSSIVEQSRVRQVEQLKEQLERVTYELNQLRFKYDKMSLDSETTPYSRRDLAEDSTSFAKQIDVKEKDSYIELAELKQKFEELQTLHQTLKNVVSGSDAQNTMQVIQLYEKKVNSLQQKLEQYQEQLLSANNGLEYKDKQIDRLVKDMENNARLIEKLAGHIEIKDKQIENLSNLLEKAVNDLNNKDKLMENQQEETQQKVKLLIESFEKQISILKQEISNKNYRQGQLKQEIAEAYKLIAAKQEAQNSIEQETANIQFKLAQGRQNSEKLNLELNYHKQQLRIKEDELIIAKGQLIQANQRISQAEQKTLQLENELKIANQKLSKIKSENMVQQLKQVKRLINPEQLLKLEVQFTQLSDLYDRTLIQYQEKVKQGQIINQKNAALMEKALQNQENNITLKQKISLLETTISVYQSQLKNRKELYENLMQRKSATQIESQKLKRQRDLANKYKFSEIKESSRIVNEKIDFILGMQTQRQKELQQLIKTIGVISYRSNKIAYSTEKSIQRQEQSQVQYFSQK